jgi:hypothetical protein
MPSYQILGGWLDFEIGSKIVLGFSGFKNAALGKSQRVQIM